MILRFLRPCPASGLFVHRNKGSSCPGSRVQKLGTVSRATGIKIPYTKVEGANHFFDNHMPEVVLTWLGNM